VARKKSRKMGPKVPLKAPAVGNKGAAQGRMAMMATPGMMNPSGSMSVGSVKQSMTRPQVLGRSKKKKRGMM
jgi:hypothetical protein